MNSQKIWIIELRTRNGWEPTIGCGLTRRDAVSEMQNWKSACPDDRFRVAKYIQAKGEKP